MNLKILSIILLALIGIVIISGCTGEKEPAPAPESEPEPVKEPTAGEIIENTQILKKRED